MHGCRTRTRRLRESERQAIVVTEMLGFLTSDDPELVRAARCLLIELLATADLVPLDRHLVHRALDATRTRPT